MMTKLKKLSLLMIITAMAIGNAGCHTSSKHHLDWQVAALLPCPPDGSQHKGLAGAISGFSAQHYLIGGGANFPEAMPWEGGKKKYHDTLHMGGITASQELMPLRYAACLPQAVAYAAQVQQADTLWVLGGEGTGGPTAQCYGITLVNDNITFTALPPLPVATTNAAACLLGQTLYVAGGETASGTTPAVWMLSLNAPHRTWKAAPPLPQATSHSVLLHVQPAREVPYLLMAGGRRKRNENTSVFYNNVWRLEPTTNTWEPATPLPVSVSAHSGAVLQGSKAYVIGGDEGTTFNKVEQLLLDIEKSKSQEAKEALQLEKASLLAAHPGFSNRVWCWEHSTQQWDSSTSLPLASPVTTRAAARHHSIFIGSGEIKAGIRTPHIIKGSLLPAQLSNAVAQ